MASSSLEVSASPLSSLAAASGLKTMATTPREAVAHALLFLTGVYGSRFQPASNSAMSWLVVLGDATAEEIAAAVLAHATDTARDTDGKMHGEFPPSAVELLEKVRSARKRVRENEDQMERNRQSCIGFFERGDLAKMKAASSWARMRPEDKTHYEQMHETGRKLVEAGRG